MARIIAPLHDTCIFCGGAPTTNEHVFPRWSHRYIQKSKGKFSRAVGATNLKVDKTVYLKGKGDIHDWQVKCVCEGCNNGWMRELENKVRPIIGPLIQGERTVLGMPDRRVIAGWAVLKAMIADRDIDGFFTWRGADWAKMRRLQTPPLKTCWVWIANYDRVDGIMHWSSYPMAHFPKARHRARIGEATTEFNSATTTQVIGKLLIHTLHTPLAGLLDKFAFSPPVAAKLRLIWPPTGEHIRRPLDTLSDAEADYVQGAVIAWINQRLRTILAARKARVL